MNGRRWTEEEIEVLRRTDITCKEIARLLGRTLKSVYARRYQMINNIVPSDGEKIYERPLAQTLTQKEKEARLYALADRIGAKIGGHNR